MFDFGIQPLELVARTTIVYAVFVLVLRVFGKRELGQFTIFDQADVYGAIREILRDKRADRRYDVGAIVVVFAANLLMGSGRRRGTV